MYVYAPKGEGTHNMLFSFNFLAKNAFYFMKGVYDMEIIYYIIDDGERVRVDKSMYDNWNGDKYIKSGFILEFPGRTIFNTATVFLGLR